MIPENMIMIAGDVDYFGSSNSLVNKEIETIPMKHWPIAEFEIYYITNQINTISIIIFEKTK